jgi:hypothetical protein
VVSEKVEGFTAGTVLIDEFRRETTSEYAKTPCSSEILNFFLLIMCFFS